MLTRKFAAIAAALIPLGLAAPLASASAAAPPAMSPTLPAAGTVMTFVPPKVGPIQVSIGPTVIGGKMISPGVNVATPGASLPPITWTLPS